MSDKHFTQSVKRIKTGSFERRLSLAKAGFMAGAKFGMASAANLFSRGEDRERKQKEILAEQARYLADELGKLKGSVVKIGQMMALYGEHFLPVEVTDALHTLEEQTAILEWPAMRAVLIDELGEARLSELDINPNPIGAASIGQVHKAVRKSDGRVICLKVQYPGVAEAVDSDLDAVERLMKLMKFTTLTQDFHEWLEEIRVMMHREVNYEMELKTTQLFRERLLDDPRFIVPETFPEYSTKRIIATAYEPGFNFNSPEVMNLPQDRRNKIGIALLDLCWREVFKWGEMQTDPNFGNYFIRLGDENTEDKLVLLDFGAVREFTSETLGPGRELVRGAFNHNPNQIFDALDKLDFMGSDVPLTLRNQFAELTYIAIEPFSEMGHAWSPPAFAVNEKGEYCWGKSDLVSRALLKASSSAFSTYFAVPPKEFMFLFRKLMGAFTTLTLINAEIKGYDVLKPYI
ncbi:MAG TPA: AarF/ABC1/UbiB kinase family protein [Pseudomonadales bacterium]|nr:AarF/ABC1/UbiB kinase family protein [Pseudomonadales bacterium]